MKENVMMKGMKGLFYCLLSTMLVLLGFSSCKDNGDYPDEYGTPRVDFQVKGTVVSGDNTPLKGIQVIVNDQYAFLDAKGLLKSDTIYTDANGTFTSKTISAVGIDGKAYFKDIDGNENGGSFASDSIALNDMQKQKIKDGDDDWYRGSYTLSSKAVLKKSSSASSGK